MTTRKTACRLLLLVSAAVNMEELIKKIAAKDEQALVKLHAVMHRRITVFVLQLLGTAQLAEEVMLETLFEVWNHAPKFAGDSQASTWILGIARHKALDKLHKIQQGKPKPLFLKSASSIVGSTNSYLPL